MTRFLGQAFIALLASMAVAAGHAATTALYFASPAGEYIGGGITKTWTPADGNFSATTNFDNGVTIYFDGGETNWRLEFAAPQNALLSVGSFLEATRYPFQSPTKPGLSVSGSGRGCNTSTGQFTVKELTYGSNNTVAIFAADFEQHCEQPDKAPLRGTVLYNAVTSTITTITSGTPTAAVNYSLKPTIEVDANGNISLTVALTVSRNHQGRQGRTFLAALVGDDTYFNDGHGWIRYTGGTMPAYRSGPISDINIKVIQGVKADSLSGVSIIVGYGASDLEMLRNKRYGVAYTF
jgi:hypothetical protein